jgi:pyruvate kinase
MRRTKIVATLGPASAEPDVVRELVHSGVDVFRLNYSHGTQEQHLAARDVIREAARERGREVGILQDLAGPKIRTGPLEGDPLVLEAGQSVMLVPGDGPIGPGKLTVSLPSLLDDLEPDQRLLLRDGRLELVVEERTDEGYRLRVLRGGELTGRAGVNLPSTLLSVPPLTDKDRGDLAHGLSIEVDFHALSFVRRGADLDEARRAAGEREIFLIAKIEKPEAIDHLDEILDRADGVMIARGDLGVEVPAEQVPLLQKRIIRAANRRCLPVITATQMLESMIDSPVPTRAEASDVANAIFDGTDAVMLSGETAAGKYPVEAVRVMARIAESSDVPDDVQQRRFRSSGHHLPPSEAVARAASRVAEDVGARAIVVYTESGTTARLLASQRPAVPVLALSPDLGTARRLRLSWGVFPRHMPRVERLMEMLEIGERILVEGEVVTPGDRVVVVSGTRAANRGGTNMMKIHTIGESWR